MEASELTPLMRKRLESAPQFKRWHVLAFFLIGVAAAMPPASFIAPKHYFMYKLRTLNNTIPNHTNGSNLTLNEEPIHKLNRMQAQYESLTIITLSIAIVLFNLVTVFITSKIRLIVRMIVPMVCVLVLLAFSCALTRIDTDSVQGLFFWVTMATVFLMTGLSIVTFASAFGFASVMPPQFLISVLGGTAFGTVVVAILNILTLLIDQDPLTSALYFFCSAIFIVLLAIAVTIATVRSGVIVFYVNTLRSSKRPDLIRNPDDVYDFDRTARRANSIANVISNRQILVYVMKKTWLVQLNAFLFHVSFQAVFPAIASAIQPMQVVKGDLWTETMFTPVTCFLICYTTQFIGRFLPRVFQFPRFQHWKWITLVSILRFAVIPLYVFSNVHPRRADMPVVFTSDVWPAIWNTIWGFTTGYFGALITLYLPKLVTGELKEHASIVAVTFTAIGQTVGGFISVGLVQLIGGPQHKL